MANFLKWLPRAVINTVLHSPSITKVIILFFLVLLCSLFYSLEVYKSEYFGNKKNFLNRNFAKLGWGWTLSCVLPVTLITSILYSGAHLGIILRHLGRITVAHVIFYGVTRVIASPSNTNWFGHNKCSSGDHGNDAECNKTGVNWMRLDISGHSFLLAYCIFVITEECKLIQLNVWSLYTKLINDEQHHHSKTQQSRINGETSAPNNLNHSRNRLLLKIHLFATPAVRLLELVACIEVFLMGVVFIATQMYYHTFVEKITGYLIAVVSWTVTYGILFGSWRFLPCAVTEGIFNPLSSVELH